MISGTGLVPLSASIRIIRLMAYPRWTIGTLVVHHTTRLNDPRDDGWPPPGSEKDGQHQTLVSPKYKIY